MKSVLFFVLVFPLGAFAASRLVVVSGECSPPLQAASSALEEALQRDGAQVVTAAVVQAALRPAPTAPLADLRGRMEALRGGPFSRGFAAAAEEAAALLEGLEAHPPGAERRALYVEGQMLLAQFYKAAGRPREMQAALLEVLKLQPGQVLDARQYSVSELKGFEEARNVRVSQPHASLTVEADVAGADVFVDGLHVGRSPLTLDVPEGRYRVEVREGSRWALPRTVALGSGGTRVAVDVGLEASLRFEPALCVDVPGRALPTQALWLARAAGADEAVLVEGEGLSHGWLTATMLAVEGGRVVRRGAAKREALAALAHFLHTGAPGADVSPWPEGTSTPWEAQPPPSVSVPHVTEPATKAPLAPTALSGMRVASLATLGVGVLGLGTAAVLRLTVQRDVKRLRSRLDANGEVPMEDAEANALYVSLQRHNQRAAMLLVTSGAALATGAVLFFIAPEWTQRRSLAVAIAADGGTVGVWAQGRF